MKFLTKPIIYFVVLTLSVITVAGIFLFKKSQAADRSSDAIGVRVMPNPEHWSIQRWYKMQRFTGSPQPIVVDGYDALRDGRTVYVNAANISADNKFYTNIYVISYNQEPGSATLDIFSQILKHWKFNNNIASSTEKQKIIRDTKRLADLHEIKDALENYKKNHNNRYPKLSSGSYLPNKTISVWPSWQTVLGKELGIALPKDPINKLGECSDGYDPITCWDQKNSKFYDPITDNDKKIFDLPENSNVYTYLVSADGSHYDFCRRAESEYASIVQGDVCLGVESNTTGNRNPKISAAGGVSSTLENGYTVIKAMTSKPFSFFVSGTDDDQNGLSNISLWKIIIIDPAITTPNSWKVLQWSDYPQIKNTDTPNIKKIFITTIGQAGACNGSTCADKDYIFHLELNDNKGGVGVSKYKIRVSNKPPMINAKDLIYTVSSTNQLNYSLIASSSPSNYPLTFSLSPVLSTLPNLKISSSSANNIYTFKITDIFTPANIFDSASKDINFTITITDHFTSFKKADFKIIVKNTQPTIDLSACAISVRTNAVYSSCQIKTTDADGNKVNFVSLGNQPIGLSLNNTTGIISGTSNAAFGTYSPKVTVKDEYGFVADKTYTLNVNTYCGDKIWQGPKNMEGVDEGCDGSSNVATTPTQSSATKQYGCTGDCKVKGGWCGDGSIQTNKGSEEGGG